MTTPKFLHVINHLQKIIILMVEQCLLYWFLTSSCHLPWQMRQQNVWFRQRFEEYCLLSSIYGDLCFLLQYLQRWPPIACIQHHHVKAPELACWRGNGREVQTLIHSLPEYHVRDPAASTIQLSSDSLANMGHQQRYTGLIGSEEVCSQHTSWRINKYH